jgi:hypothetical protein
MDSRLRATSGVTPVCLTRVSYGNWLAVAGAAVFLAGCAAGQDGPGPAPFGRCAVPAADVAAHQTPQQRAAAAAAALLAAFIPGCHGARRGTYRIVYRIDETSHIVQVLDIDHRSEIYRRLQQ